MISTRDLAAMPDIVGARRLTRSVAMLDAIVCEEWEFRYYSFNTRWADGELMASMRNGSGDHWFVLFTEAGAALLGLAHEAPMFRHDRPWPGIWESLPDELAGFRAEPAFDTANSTFCIWRRDGDARWQCGDIEYVPAHDDPDGSRELLAIFDGRPETYRAWASDYYERDLPLDAVTAVYEHTPLTEELVRALAPDASLGRIRDDIDEIGYPERG